MLRLSIAAALLPAAVLAQPMPEDEQKAAFVFNFALFADWPADTVYEGGTFNLCIHPASRLRQSLAGLAGRSVRGRRLAVRNAGDGDNLRPCHVLVLDGADRLRWKQLRKPLAAAGVLTVSDDEAIGRQGAIIALSMQQRRVVFDIDLQAARRAGLTLSSKLLRLARKVN